VARGGCVAGHGASLPSGAGTALRQAPDIEPAGWQAIVADRQEREPVTAMAVLRAGLTGTRRGELAGLRSTDISPQGRMHHHARRQVIPHGRATAPVTAAAVTGAGTPQ
jgi:hypothetical protein